MIKKHILRSYVISAAASTFLFSASVLANDGDLQPSQTYTHNGVKYPPILLVTNIDKPSLSDIFNQYQAFSNIDKEKVGLPIGIRVLKLHRTKNDSTQFSTAMLAASTLGLLPIVSNTEFKVRYDVFAQGEIVSTFTYQVDSTEVSNLWSNANKKNKTKPEEELFIEDSVSRFLNEVKNSEETQALFKEYREYFPNDS
jgi:hypothetical protein